jgi:coenzyme F420-0:L-glutamate ligase / coenzyme F420-1:gamma-L-glutamate ligase
VRLEVLPVEGIGEVTEGDDLGALIASAATLQDGDVVVVTQKIVSKAEGRLVAIDPERREAERTELALREAVRVVAKRGDLVITETRHGLVCANAGIDGSNVPRDRLALLPEDPDASAARIRSGLESFTGRRVAVIVSDTFGRPWRTGQTNVAIGLAGMPAIRDHIGATDPYGNVLQATEIAVADEIAAAAELVMGKIDGVPVAIVRGLGAEGEGSANSLVRRSEDDLFRSGSSDP